MPKPANSEKKFNPTVTAVFPNEKFGEGALLSAEIDAKAYDVLQNIEIGQKFLLRPSTKTTKAGETYYFMEVLPKFNRTKSGSAPRRAAASDDI